MNTKTLFILAIIIAVLGVAFFFRDSREESNFANDSSSLIINNSAIYVAEQTPGRSVSVLVVRLEKPGFVVIHEDAAGVVGKILGVSGLLTAGETKNLPPITLARATIDGGTVYAMLHLDNGDSGFDPTKDKPALDPVDSAPIMMVVTISKDAIEPGAVNP